MSIVLTMYQNKLMNEILAASCYRDIKTSINNTLASLKKLNVSPDQVLKMVAASMNELKTLERLKLSYNQKANVVSAQVQLQQMHTKINNAVS